MTDTTHADQIQQAIYTAILAAKDSLGLASVQDQAIDAIGTDELDAIDVRLVKTLPGPDAGMEDESWIAEIELHIYSKTGRVGPIHKAAHSIAMAVAQPGVDLAFAAEHQGIEQDTVKAGDITAILRVATYRYQFYEPYGQI